MRLPSMQDDLLNGDSAALNRRRLITRAVVIVIWVMGVIMTIRSGWIPGFWHDGRQPWPYPLREVLLEIGKITLITVGLYDFLRPQPDASSLRRTVRALGVLFITLVWVTMFSVTDQPGYAYATGTYVALVVLILFAAVIGHLLLLGISAFRGQDR